MFSCFVYFALCFRVRVAPCIVFSCVCVHDICSCVYYSLHSVFVFLLHCNIINSFPLQYVFVYLHHCNLFFCFFLFFFHRCVFVFLLLCVLLSLLQSVFVSLLFSALSVCVYFTLCGVFDPLLLCRMFSCICFIPAICCRFFCLTIRCCTYY